MGAAVPGFSRLARTVAVAMWPAALGFGLLSLLIARSHPGATFGGTPLMAGLAQLGAGGAVIGAGLYVCRRRMKRAGPGPSAPGVASVFPAGGKPVMRAAPAFTFAVDTDA